MSEWIDNIVANIGDSATAVSQESFIAAGRLFDVLTESEPSTNSMLARLKFISLLIGRIKRLEAALAVYADHGRWRVAFPGNPHVVFTDKQRRTAQYGWSVAEEALGGGSDE